MQRQRILILILGAVFFWALLGRFGEPDHAPLEPDESAVDAVDAVGTNIETTDPAEAGTTALPEDDVGAADGQASLLARSGPVPSSPRSVHTPTLEPAVEGAGPDETLRLADQANDTPPHSAAASAAPVANTAGSAAVESSPATHPLLASDGPELDPNAPWRDNARRINEHFRDHRQGLREAGAHNDQGWWVRHQQDRIRYEASLSDEARAALPGRGEPSATVDQFGWILKWDVERYGGAYETRITAAGPSHEHRTPVEVVTYDRETGQVEASYAAVAFVDVDGTIEIDAIGQRVESDVWQSWSPDSFSLRPDGEMRTIDDKFDGSTGIWAPGGDG